jgi:hypothetical protein
MGAHRHTVRLWLAAWLPAVPLAAQDLPDRPLPELEYQADRHDDAETPEEEAALFDAAPRPWSIAPWIPLNWRSNLALAPRAIRSGLAFEPEATLGRSWDLGGVRIIAEGSAFVSAVPSDAARSSSGWWLTGEATTGDPALGMAPYATYEPLTLHDGIFGGRILTFHTITAGVRRRWGPTNLNVFLRRRDATIDSLDRTLVAAQFSHTQGLGGGLSFNIRTDAELRRYDRQGDIRRRDLFVRARARLFIPLSSAADLVLTADIQRNRSSERDFVTTQVVIGPALSARFGL